MAASLVQLLTQLFPGAIDNLPPESSMIDGELPLLLTDDPVEGMLAGASQVGGLAGPCMCVHVHMCVQLMLKTCCTSVRTIAACDALVTVHPGTGAWFDGHVSQLLYVDLQ